MQAFKRLLNSGVRVSYSGSSWIRTPPLFRFMSTDVIIKQPQSKDNSKMSSAMKYYLSKKLAHDSFMEEQKKEFEIGKKKLGEIMGYENPESLTQEDINECIEYLFPSGLEDVSSRPAMKPPEMIFPKQKDAEFDIDGRPFHPFFYAVSPSFVRVMYDLVEKYEIIQYLGNRLALQGQFPDPEQMLDASSFSGTRWISKIEVEEIYLEKISDSQYMEFIETLERISDHPLSYKIKDFLSSYRKRLAESISTVDDQIEPSYDEKGRAYVVALGQRKSSMAQVRVTKPGTGKFQVTHIDYPEYPKDINYFDNFMERHQIMFPLQFTRLLGEVDVEAIVDAGGGSSQAGAIRYATAVCLKSFVDREMIDEMKLVGLLTRDVRVKERKRAGLYKSRKKRKYKKR